MPTLEDTYVKTHREGQESRIPDIPITSWTGLRTMCYWTQVREIFTQIMAFFALCSLIGVMLFVSTESSWAAMPAPVLALSFDEESGTTVNDSSGNGNNGTVLGATWTTSGKYGGALDFNGSNSRVAIADSNSLDLTNGMTIEAWVYPTSTPTGWQPVVTKEVPGDGVYTLYANTAINNTPYMGIMINSSPQSVSGLAQLAVNTWTHVAATYDGSTLILYINGIQVATQAVSGIITTSAQGLSIGGAELSTEFFKGRIDNVRIYNQALAAGDIVTLRDTPITAGPRLVIIQPASNETLSGAAVNIAYSVNGNSAGADHAVFQLDSASPVSDATLDGAYQFTNVSFGPHTLTGYLALADNTKIAGSDAIAVSFINSDPSDQSPPTVNITSPIAGSIVSGTTIVQATGIDNVGVIGVQFYLDNSPLGSEVTGNGSTTLFQMNWDTSTTTEVSHALKAIARDQAGNQTTSSTVTVTVANGSNPATLGSWSSLVNWPLVAVHMSLLPTGEVMVWDAWENQAQAKIWNSTTQQFIAVPSLYGLFCSVHTLMADGRLLVAGGHDPSLPNGEWGIRQTNIFDPFTKSWISASNMSNPRWYPGGVRLSDGRIVTVSGGITATAYADNPEIYDPAVNTWTTMSSVNTSGITTSDGYPRTFLLPDGRVFIGAEENGPVKLLDVSNNRLSNFGNGPMLHYSAAQYRPGKILISGGGTGNIDSPTTTTPTIKLAYVIDMNQPTPAFRQVASMAYGRFQHNLTVMADGRVFGVGGADRLALQASSGPLTPEIWDPTTEIWTKAAPMQNNRNYHSTSLLMPDGRILVAGGGRLGVATNFLTAEIYSPSYLFKGSRPTITSTPSNSSLGSTMIVQTPDAASIANVALVPLASITHTMDWNQNYIPLTFTANSGQLQIAMPTNANIGRPGYYMLFILNAQGVPAIAPIFQLLAAGTDTIPPLVPGTLTVTGGIGSASLSWGAATDNVGVVLYDVYRSTTSGFTPSTANRIAQATGISYRDTGLAAGTYYYLVTAQDAAGNIGSPTNQGSAVVTAMNNISYTIWNGGGNPVIDDAPDTNAVELGVKFKSDVAGVVTGVLFYKSVNNTGTHVGNLWSSAGALLATVTFAGETASGWQQANFSSPVAISANTTYVISYHTNVGHYAATSSYFASAGFDNAPLHALSNAAGAGNGLYLYGAGGFPSQTYNSANYWVDVAFQSSVSNPVISAVTATPSATLANITWNTDIPSDSKINYGTSPASLTSTVTSATLTTSHALSLTGLTAGTVYYYTVTSTGTTLNSSTYPASPAAPATFTTLTSPVVISAINVVPTATSATITWTTNVASSSRVDFGASTGTLTQNQSNASLVTSHTIVLTGLSATSVYYYRVTSVDNASNSTTIPTPPAAPSSFTTLDNIPPVISAIAATPGAGGLAVITWNTDEASTSRVDYGTATGSLTLNSTNASLVTSHSITLSGLTQGTTYYYRVTSADASNNSATSPASPAAPNSFAENVAVVSSTIFSPSSAPININWNDPSAVELGVKFQSDVAGQVSAVRFYKGSQDIGTHIGNLWNTAGQLLGTVTFTNETASGWQQANFAVPVSINANTTYVVSYHTNGHYAGDGAVFTNAGIDNPPLHALSNAAAGGNGVYLYGAGGYPNQFYNASNYWVDLVLQVTPAVPAITSFTPTSGNVGSSVVITGTNFTGAFGVTFNGVTAPTFTVNSATQITVTVPTGATTGAIAVTTPAGTATSAAIFTVTVPPVPTISSFSPTSGTVGTSVVIAGTNFTGATVVSFNNVPAVSYTVNSSAQITAIVPSGATSGLVRVTVPGGTATSASNFAVTVPPIPTITSFSPTSGPIGTSVVITGTNFTGSSAVSFNNVAAASFTVNSATQITVAVPTGATTGTIKVTAPGGTGTSASSYTVTAPVIPIVSSFSPASGLVGSSVVITGSNFTGATVVSINNIAASFTLNSATQITAVVPAGASTGLIRVTSPGGTGASVTNFSVILTFFTAAQAPANVNWNDPSAVELGVKFRVDNAATVTGVRFFKGSLDVGTHIGNLWTSTGVLLGTVTFTGESASGWQQANFASPIAISANTTYVISYHTNGFYAGDGFYFSAAGVNNGPLHALQNGVDGGNGVYLYGAGGFPSLTWNASNYWVDVALTVP